MRRLLLLCVVFVGLVPGVLLLALVASPQEELDPVKIMPDTHKLLFENKLVRVIEAKVPPGGVERKHKHPQGVTVYLADYTIEMKTLPDGKVSRHERKFGTVSWGDAVVHEVKNVGKTASHAVRIELKY